MQRSEAGKPRGIVHAATGPGYHKRYLPVAALAPFIAHFWAVGWDLRGQPPRRVETLPHPSVHIVFETGRPAEIGGVHLGRFSRELCGLGRVFGIKFRPGGFYPFLGQAMTQMTGRVLPLTEVFGPESAKLTDQIMAMDADEARIELAEAFLCDRLPAADPIIEQVIAMVDTIVADPGLTKVDDLVERFGLSKRNLQRVFRDYVGIAPKWMIQRYRLHEALEQLTQSTPPDWSQLALSLGYFDQAHFIKDFRAVVGTTPKRYWDVRSAAPAA